MSCILHHNLCHMALISACADAGGYCLYEANCGAEVGSKYVCETEGLVCCLPPVCKY
jgi:hypothetical protein